MPIRKKPWNLSYTPRIYIYIYIYIYTTCGWQYIYIYIYIYIYCHPHPENSVVSKLFRDVRSVLCLPLNLLSSQHNQMANKTHTDTHAHRHTHTHTHIYIYIYIYIVNRVIVLVGKVFANGPGDRGSILFRVIPKTLKMVLDTSLLNTQQYKVRLKDKVEQSRERRCSPVHLGVVAIEKGAFWSPPTRVTNFTFTYLEWWPSVVQGDQMAPFSIVRPTKCKGECYSFY